MVECPRCSQHVDTLHFVEPEMVSTGLLESMDNDRASPDTEGDLEVCAECLNELARN